MFDTKPVQDKRLGEFRQLDVWAGECGCLFAVHCLQLDFDLNRISAAPNGVYNIFNPKDGLRPYEGEAYLTVKTFLIFRELRIQFRNLRRYQYHPAICCIPDSNVRKALSVLGLLDHTRGDLDNMIHASEIAAEYFCNERYELYDLPLFFWYQEGKPRLNTEPKES